MSGGGESGGDDEPLEPEIGQPGTVSTGVSLALDGVRHDPALRGPITDFLDDQRRLAADQRANLHEMLRHAKLKHFDLRLGVAFKLGLAALGLIVLSVVAIIAWQAANSRALVIEPFSVPPELAQKGLTGQAAARLVQDQLAALQEESGSARAPANFKNAFGHDIKVEIPETGVALGDLEQFLRAWLGRETRVTGEIFRTGEQGLTVTVRSGEEGAISVEGDAASAPQLAREAAKKLFGRIAPYRYAMWLMKADRTDEARAVLTELVATGAREDRAWGWLGLDALAAGPAEAREFELRAVRADPTLSQAWADLADTDADLGRAQEALDAARKAVNGLRRDRGRRINELAADWDRAIAGAVAASALADYAGALAALDRMRGRPDYFDNTVRLPYLRAAALTGLHRPGEALSGLPEPNDLAVVRKLLPLAYLAVPYSNAAASLDDWAEVERQLAPLNAEPYARASAAPTLAWPLLARALARTGRIPEAQALIARTPVDCDPCLRARGEIAALAGDQKGAERWFEEAVRRGPSLPFARADLGASLIAAGAPRAALPHLQEARRRAPRWADPVELQGEALLKLGNARTAAQRFKAASRLAPRWGHNRLRWGEALLELDRRDAARHQFLTARGLDLSAADRAAVETHLAR